MTVVALIPNDLVVGVQPSAFPDLPLSDQFNAALNPTDVTNVSPQPQVGWIATRGSGGAWTFTPPPAPVAPPPTPAQQAQAAIAAGCHVTSSSTPALDGTYPCDATSQQHVQAEVTSILLNGTFADGSTSVEWLDTSGTAHTFMVAQFKALATALAAYVSGCLKVVNGQATTLPAQPASIP